MIRTHSSRSLHAFRAVLALGGGVLPMGLARAAEPLDQVIVTATRTPLRDIDIPFVAHVVSRDTMQNELQARMFPDGLADLPSVVIQRTSYGQASPTLRGFTGFRTLVLVDGIRLNNSTWRDGPNQYSSTIDTFAVDRTEVVMGPASVLFGSDAVGGAIHARTLNQSADAAAFGWGSQLHLRYATADRSQVGRAQVGHRGDRTQWRAGVTWRDLNDLRAGGGIEQPYTGYEERAGDLRFSAAVGDHGTLTLAHQSMRQYDVPRTHATVAGQSFEGTLVGTDLRHEFDQARDLSYAQLELAELGPLVDVTLNLSRQEQDESRDRVRSNGRLDVQTVGVGTLGLWAQASLEARRGLWTFGFDYYGDEVDSSRRDYNVDGSLRTVGLQGPVADDASYDLAGLFLQNQWSWGRTQLTAGVRQTYAGVDADTVEDPVARTTSAIDERWRATVGSVRALLPLETTERWSLYGGVSQAFRAPNLSDLTRLDTARGNEIETPVTTLDPERFSSVEFGVKHDGARIVLRAALFFTQIDQMIIRTPTGRIIDGLNEVTKLNAGAGHASGVETQLGWQASQAWRLETALTYMDGELDTYPTSAPVLVRESLDRLAPLTAQFTASFSPPGKRYWIALDVTSAGEQRELSTRDRGDSQRIPPLGTPSYSIADLRGSWSLSTRSRLNAKLGNLTDQAYRVHGSGVNEAGRELVVSVDYRLE